MTKPKARKKPKDLIRINELREDADGRYWSASLWFGKASLIAKEYRRYTYETGVDGYFGDVSLNRGVRFSLNDWAKMRRPS